MFHRTKSHVSVFLKRGGNMQLHGSVIFTETRVNVTKSTAETRVNRRVSATVSHISATFPFTDS